MSDDGAQAAAHHLLGRTIGGRFQLRSLLGTGGMASVHLAHDAVLDRPVAVKTLHTELGREASFRERFRREAQSVAKLTHTNIVSVFDSGEDEVDGVLVPYIVMEYVEGQPLRGLLDADVARFGAMPAEKALKITSDVLAALDVSHEMGLVHRDIKPGNVMVTKRGVVKVMDFGIARAMQSGVTSMTQTGMVVGTPQYLSPEQALGRGVDARSDLYSVGIMLFELLTGRLPFDADSPLAIAYAHVQEEPPVPSSINQSLPPAVDALVARALRKNPNERFPSAEAMRDECARIGGSGAASGFSPSIVAGAPTANSGAGVGQAVFPPVGDSGAPPHGVHQPYPAAGGPGHGPGFGGYGPSAPPPPATGPMGQGGYSTPPPHPAAYQGAGAATPPPYGRPTAPSPAGGGRRSNLPVILGSVVAAVAAVTVLGVLLSTQSSGEDGPTGGGDNRASSAGQDPAGSSGDAAGTSAGTGEGRDTTGEESGEQADEEDQFKPEDKSKTIDATKCTEATQSWSDKNKVSVPDFTTKNLSSVKACIREAGWKLGDVTYEDENVWGKNAVLDQDPGTTDGLDPENDKIELTVSTGKPS